MKGFRIILLTAATLIFGSVLPGIAAETNNYQGNAPNPAAAATPHIVKFVHGATTLSGRPDSDVIEFSGGNRMSVRDLRRVVAASQKMHGPMRPIMLPSALKMKPNPGAIKMKIATASDLATAVKRADSDTVQLPSGKIATVAQLKFVLPYVEKRKGRKLADLPMRPALTGPAIKLTSTMTKEQMRDIFDSTKTPDSTVLESPHGKRITVGELKDEMKSRYIRKRNNIESPSMTPKTSAPALQPGQDGKRRVK